MFGSKTLIYLESIQELGLGPLRNIFSHLMLCPIYPWKNCQNNQLEFVFKGTVLSIKNKATKNIYGSNVKWDGSSENFVRIPITIEKTDPTLTSKTFLSLSTKRSKMVSVVS